MHGIKIDRLGLTMIVVTIASLGAPIRQAHIDPVGGLIADALKTTQVHKGLSQVERMTLDRLPIVA
jgi:hypothetical protein